MNRRSIPTKPRLLVIRVVRRAEATHRNQLLHITIRTSILHSRNRGVAPIHTHNSLNKVTTTGRRLTRREPSGPSDPTPIQDQEILLRNNSDELPEGIPTLMKMAAKKLMTGKTSSIGAAGATAHHCPK